MLRKSTHLTPVVSKGVLMVPMEQMAKMVHQEQMALMVQMENGAHLDLRESIAQIRHVE